MPGRGSIAAEEKPGTPRGLALRDSTRWLARCSGRRGTTHMVGATLRQGHAL